MAINRTKILDRAQKYVQQGKLAKAVEEYNLLIEDDPSDVRTLLKVGDIYARMGNIEAGLETYKRVADFYSKDGFFLKAVAVYKQMLKLDPSSITIYTQLAQLYSQLGLNNEAMKQYQIVAKHYETKGMKKESLEIYKKIAELNPDNIASRVKLAELALREGETDQSLADFKKIAVELKSKGNNEDLIRIYERIVKLDVNDMESTRELAGLYLEINEPKRALAKLQICFKQDSKNEVTLTLLARSFIELQQPEKARAVYTELLNIYQDKGMYEKAQVILAKLAGESALDSSDPMISSRAASIASMSQSADATSAPPPPPLNVAATFEDPSEKLLTDVEVYLRYGLNDKAIQALQVALKLRPDMPTARQRLAEIFLANNDTKAAANSLMQVATAAREKNDQNLEMAILGEILSFESDHVEALQRLNELQKKLFQSPRASAEVQELEIVAVEAEVADDMVVELPDSADANESLDAPDMLHEANAATEFQVRNVDAVNKGQSQESFDSELVIESDESEDAPVLALPVVDLGADLEHLENEMLRGGDGAEEGRFSLGDLSSGESPAIDLSAEFSNEEPIAEAIADAELAVPATPEEAFDLSDFGTSVEPQPPVVAPIVAPKPTAKPMAKPVVKPATKKDQHQSELDEIEFFISQGLHDEAVDLVKSILEISPQHPQALAFAADLGLNQPEKKTPPPQPTASPKPIAKPVFKSEPTEEIPFSAEMERPQGDSLHLEGESEIAGQDGFFDLADELKEEIHNLNAGPGQPSDDEPLSFDEVFSAFKKGVQETVSEDETEAHYNLGIAYKEMGLMDDAISEFRIALKDIRLSVDACSLIGICYREMGRFKESAASFMKAIDSLAVGDERVMALKYDLADTQVAAGELREALASFKEVYNINQSFRDVSHRMKELAEGLEGGVVDENLDQSKDTKKKSKISYL